MKPSSVLCAIIVAFAVLTLTGQGAFAITSQSNIYKRIDPKDKDAVKACKKDGGKVGKDTGGHDSCVIPLPPDK